MTPSTVVVREFAAADTTACRSLYAQLVEHHREIYDDPTIGGADPGSGFADYLARPDRVATWVAIDGDVIVGLTGLLWKDQESTIEPVIVDRDRRGTGIGRQLVETAIDDARQRGATDVNIEPVARNASAIQAFHRLGFRTIGHIQLFLSLGRDASYWQPGPSLHGRDFEL